MEDTTGRPFASPKRVMRRVSKPGYTKIVESPHPKASHQIPSPERVLFPEEDDAAQRIKNEEQRLKQRKEEQKKTKKEKEEEQEDEALKKKLSTLQHHNSEAKNEEALKDQQPSMHPHDELDLEGDCPVVVKTSGNGVGMKSFTSMEMQGLLISVANEFIKSGGNGRYKRILENKAKDEQRDADTIKCLEYVAATDITFLEGIDLDSLLMALRRREAWRTRPLIMAYVTLAQMILCILMLLSPSLPVNRQTIIFGFIYLGTRFAFNEFATTKSLISLTKATILSIMNNVGTIPGILIVSLMSPLCLPFLLVGLVGSFLFDWLVGKIQDWSMSAGLDMAVNAMVEATAMSIGLRSGTCTYSIQAFVGFGFISLMDEAVVSLVEFDPYMASKSIHKREHAQLAKALSMVFIYTFVPAVALVVSYFTFTNQCVLFCAEGSQYMYYVPIPQHLRFAGPAMNLPKTA